MFLLYHYYRVGVLLTYTANVHFILRTTPTFIKSWARKTIIITPTIIMSPKRIIFVGTRISIRFQLTLIGFQTYIPGIIIPGVSRDGDRSIEGGVGLIMRSEHYFTQTMSNRGSTVRPHCLKVDGQSLRMDLLVEYVYTFRQTLEGGAFLSPSLQNRCNAST